MSTVESDLNAGNDNRDGNGASAPAGAAGSAPTSATGSAPAGSAGSGSASAAAGASASACEGITSPDCLAQAEVRMPWLDFNARLQLKGSGPKKETRNKSSAGFRLPGLAIRKKEKKTDETTNGDKKSASDSDDWPELAIPKKKRVWHGFDGLSVMALGIALPAFILLTGFASLPKRITLVLLNHPIETIVELLLLISLPVANYFVWSALCKRNVRFALFRALALGSAAGASLFTATVCLAAVFAGQSLQSDMGSELPVGLTWIALSSLLSGGVSIYLANKVRLTHDFAKSRLRILTFTVAGMIMSLLAFASAEARPWYVRMAEEKAVSDVADERNQGMQLLRSLNPEKELLMECSDPRAAGLCGLFLPIKPSSQHQLYFALTGKPFSFKDANNTDLSSMPDDYLSRHVVGEKIKGLSLTRSSLTGIVHPNTSSSTLDWTFVFKNQSQTAQEARMEIGLPPGSVITGLTLWKKGEPADASFAASGKAEKYVTNSTTAGHDSPAIITDLGHGRMLLHCFPVSETEELKVRVTVVTPLKPDSTTASTLAIPRLIAENFDLGDENQIRLRSTKPLDSSAKSLTAGVNPDGTKAIFGSLTREQLENANVIVTAHRDQFVKPIAVLDKLAIEFKKEEDRRKEQIEQRRNRRHRVHRLDSETLSVTIDGSRSIQKQFEELTNALERRTAAASPSHKSRTHIKALTPQYVMENINKTAAPAPKNLLIVVDGSATVKDYCTQLVTALETVPRGVPTKVLIAANEDKQPLPLSISDAVHQLEKESFTGGHDNLKAVVKAAELAGETRGGAVLWIHGPQPVLNQEIYIMAPYVAAPAFYELPVGAGDTDTYDYFKNHTEIGPFTQVPRSSPALSDDLRSFFLKWRDDVNGYAVTLSQTSAKPEQVIAATPEEGRELLALHANQEVSELIRARHIRKAARVAVAYGLVSPVSSALVTETNNNDTDIDDANKNAEEASGGGNNTSENEIFANAVPGSVPSATGENAPQLQGAANGTIGPQGADTTYVTGVNTAGTVRVNNLANLEAMLNIIANLFEVGGLLLGGIIVLHSLANKEVAVEMLGQEIEIGQGHRIAIGIGLILLALSFPGLVNWFVASARDANLFS